MALRSYLATEIALDHVDGLLTRREALQRLGLLGLTARRGVRPAVGLRGRHPRARRAEPGARRHPRLRRRRGHRPHRGDHLPRWHRHDVRRVRGGAEPAAARCWSSTRTAGSPTTSGAVTGRLAGDGYTALAPGPALRGGRHRGAADATAALGAISEAPTLVADLRSGLAELGRRASGANLGAVGFCFGGGMVWQLLDSGPTELAAAAPFYGPAPDNPSVHRRQGRGARHLRRAGRPGERGPRHARPRATAAGVTHEFVTEPGAGHAFFNDTGQRYNPTAAADAYRRLLAWFGTHLG